MKVFTLKLNSHSEWTFLTDLLRRLNIQFELTEETTTPKTGKRNQDSIAELFGSWHSDKSSDEIIADIHNAPYS
jgi:hypothetical protein